MPEAVGRRAAHALLEEISRGGVVDSEHQARARPPAAAALHGGLRACSRPRPRCCRPPAAQGLAEPAIVRLAEAAGARSRRDLAYGASAVHSRAVDMERAPSESHSVAQLQRDEARPLERRLSGAAGPRQGLALLFCALGPEELSEVRLGPLTPHAVRTLRHLKAFFGVTFNVRPEAASRTIFLTCIGAGLRNASRRLT